MTQALNNLPEEQHTKDLRPGAPGEPEEVVPVKEPDLGRGEPEQAGGAGRAPPGQAAPGATPEPGW